MSIEQNTVITSRRWSDECVEEPETPKSELDHDEVALEENETEVKVSPEENTGNRSFKSKNPKFHHEAKPKSQFKNDKPKPKKTNVPEAVMSKFSPMSAEELFNHMDDPATTVFLTNMESYSNLIKSKVKITQEIENSLTCVSARYIEYFKRLYSLAISFEACRFKIGNATVIAIHSDKDAKFCYRMWFICSEDRCVLKEKGRRISHIEVVDDKITYIKPNGDPILTVSIEGGLITLTSFEPEKDLKPKFQPKPKFHNLESKTDKPKAGNHSGGTNHHDAF
jgi:hypothetical protein